MTKEKTESMTVEISIVDVLSTLWKSKKLIIWSAGIFAGIGLFVAILSPKEWQAKSKLFLESEGGLELSGSLSGIAGLAGVSLPNTSDQGISPLAYEDILNSPVFIGTLLKEEFYVSQLADSVIFDDYFKNSLKKSILGRITSLPSAIIDLFGRGSETETKVYSEYIELTEKEEKKYEKIRNRISLEYDSEKKMVNISFMIQDPLLAAQVTRYLQEYLQAYVLEFGSQSEKRKLDFISNQLTVKEQYYKTAQENLANFKDTNLGLDTNASRIEEQRLNGEYQMSLKLYSAISERLEEAKIAYEESLPILQSLGPIKVPANEMKPRKPLVILGFLFFGVALSIGYIFIRPKVGLILESGRNSN